jgi:rRNA-processing protein FCF1
VRREWVGRKKRLKNFRAAEFDFVLRLIGGANLFTTPNIATEVSNLVESNEELRTAILPRLQAFLKTYEEKYVESRLVSEIPAYLRLGISDSVLLQLAQNGTLVLTDDLPLAQRLESASLPVINFNHLRQYI